MNTALRAELLRRMEKDQAARHVDDPAAEAEVDAENLSWLRRLIDAHGWPGVSLVGSDGAQAAWLLAQHADRDPAFQRRCLDLLIAAAETGEATRQQLAYLTDRVMLAEGEPQEYGTQLIIRNDQRVPLNLRDPDTVDGRRAAMDLPPLADYLEHFESPWRAALNCPGCGALAPFEPPEALQPVTITCPGCGRKTTITLN